ncbi:archaea-specific SMC-related protein [Halodesulfurarchaeum sp.]|uniref:archaea-specific SMC-related protein n=1 Tax=Halodesulfurarchaeum sp. TaxID=1980530 RepID=UPI002FC3B018
MTVEISIANVGGIRNGQSTIESGLNVVRGANWKGKTSFIHAVESALGIPVSITEGSDSGSVTLSGDGLDANVEITQTNGTPAITGTPILETKSAQAKARLYACLDELNPIRQAIRTGENLESVLTRPLDLENIDERIGELKSERDQIDSEIAKAENSKNAIPQVKERIVTLESQIAEHKSRLEELEAGEGEGVSDKRDELSQVRSKRNRLQSEINRLNRSIDRYKGKIEEYESELQSISVEDIDVDYGDIEAKKEELDEIRSDIKVLESLFTANNLVLEENSLGLISDVEHGLDTDAFQCWICGGETTRQEVESNITQLQEKLQVRRSKLNDIKGELNALETEYEQHQQQQKRKQVLEEDIQDLERELADKKQTLADRDATVADLETRINSLSADVDESVEEITDIESELKFRQTELEEAEEELEQHQRSAYQLDQLEDQREEIREELTELRDRKSSIKAEMRETFQETIQKIINDFETGFESARLTSNFKLVVARNGHEANLEALSEGELEILGFVAALAGYEAFDVSETVPFLLLDGLEALSDDNLHQIVTYFENRAEYLLITAHPEHANFSGHQIDPTEWKTVSNSVMAGLN